MSTGFGDITTKDKTVFPFMPDGRPCYTFNECLVRYNETLLEWFYTTDHPEYAVYIHLAISVIFSLALFFLFERPAQRVFQKGLFAIKNMIVRTK